MRHGVEFLDVSERTAERLKTILHALTSDVSMRRLSLSRDDEGRWRIWRQYHFEYSIDGLEREHGNVIMLGNRMQALVMADPRPTMH